MSEDLVNDIKNAISIINDPHMGISIVEMENLILMLIQQQ